MEPPPSFPPSLLFLPPDVYDVIILSYGARHHHRRISQPSNRGKEKGGREKETQLIEHPSTHHNHHWQEYPKLCFKRNQTFSEDMFSLLFHEQFRYTYSSGIGNRVGPKLRESRLLARSGRRGRVHATYQDPPFNRSL